MDSADRIAAAKSTCKSLNSYAEVSPSGTGIRIFAFSKKLVGNGQSPMGEMYSSGRFLTVTGHGKPHEIQDATIELAKLEKTWWPKESRSENYPDLEVPPKPVFPDTPKNRATLYIWLRNLSADCDYERYRDCVWAILSTEWKDAEEMAYRWCKSTPERFDPTSFDLVVNSYSAEHSNPITIRSLAYWSNSVIHDE